MKDAFGHGRDPRHGHGRRGRITPEYHTWKNMLTRCRNPRVSDYKHYGGRGIKVCDRWLDFANFLADMGRRPPGLTLNRINNNGNYEPGNCEWTTRKKQNNNRRIRKDANRALIWGREAISVWSIH